MEPHDDHERSGTSRSDDAALAADVASVAGRLLLALQQSRLLGSPALGAAGDAVAHQVIAHALRAHRPHDAILSEEGADDLSRLKRSRVWVVDPLDGTREYAELRTDWTVHVALAVDGSPGPAAIALPALGMTLTTERPPPLAEAPHLPLRMVVSRTRAPPLASRVAERLGARIITMGSAGAKTLAVLSGEVDIYLHAGGQYEWDSCAPVALALAAGLHASRTDGSPCRYNARDPAMPDLLICRPELADAVLDAIARIQATMA